MLIYKPNKHEDLGVGFNYKALSLNLGIYIPFTGKRVDVYGATHSFDLQTNIIVKSYLVDFYAQFYHGYYLSNGGEALISNLPSTVIVRPDIRTYDLKLNVIHIFNDQQFSPNAPFYQNEIQKKSAGSFLLGGGACYSSGKGDSSFIPTLVKKKDFFQNHMFNAFSYTEFACQAGYEYTRVIRSSFFVTASLAGGPGLGYSVITNTMTGGSNGRIGPVLNAIGKFAAGWSSDRYFAGITYVRLLTENNSVVAGTREEGNAGSFKVTVAERFKLNRSLIPKSQIIKME